MHLAPPQSGSLWPQALRQDPLNRIGSWAKSADHSDGLTRGRRQHGRHGWSVGGYFKIFCGYPRAIHLGGVAKPLKLLDWTSRVAHCGIGLICSTLKRVRSRLEHESREFKSVLKGAAATQRSTQRHPRRTDVEPVVRLGLQNYRVLLVSGELENSTYLTDLAFAMNEHCSPMAFSQRITSNLGWRGVSELDSRVANIYFISNGCAR